MKNYKVKLVVQTSNLKEVILIQTVVAQDEVKAVDEMRKLARSQLNGYIGSSAVEVEEV
jgi:hypothetical protein